VRGWELVIAGLSADVLARVTPRARRVTEISAGRYALELLRDESPDRMLVELTATGATLVSLNPIRDTLEDFFMKRVAEMGAGARSPMEEESSARH